MPDLRLTHGKALSVEFNDKKKTNNLPFKWRRQNGFVSQQEKFFEI